MPQLQSVWLAAKTSCNKLVVIFALVIIDQTTKLAARNWQMAVLNSGGMLGVFPGKAWVLMMTVGIIGFLWWSRKNLQSKFEKFSGAVIVGSGVSNLFDRLVWGGVWDFIYYPYLNVTGNVADVMLGVGVGLLLFSEFKGHRI